MMEIQKVAETEDISLNKAVLRLLEKGAGLARAGAAPDRIGDSLDRYFGGMSEEDAAAIDDATRAMDAVDLEYQQREREP